MSCSPCLFRSVPVFLDISFYSFFVFEFQFIKKKGLGFVFGMVAIAGGILKKKKDSPGF